WITSSLAHRDRRSFPTRRSSDLPDEILAQIGLGVPFGIGVFEGEAKGSEKLAVHAASAGDGIVLPRPVEGDDVGRALGNGDRLRSEEHTSELQSRENLVCRLLLE